MNKAKRLFLQVLTVGFLMGSTTYVMAEEKAPAKSTAPAKKGDGKGDAAKGDKGGKKDGAKTEKEPYIF